MAQLALVTVPAGTMRWCASWCARTLTAAMCEAVAKSARIRRGSWRSLQVGVSRTSRYGQRYHAIPPHAFTSRSERRRSPIGTLPEERTYNGTTLLRFQSDGCAASTRRSGSRRQAACRRPARPRRHLLRLRLRLQLQVPPAGRWQRSSLAAPPRQTTTTPTSSSELARSRALSCVAEKQNVWDRIRTAL